MNHVILGILLVLLLLHPTSSIGGGARKDDPKASQAILDEAARFESHLDADDILYITQDNPTSYFRQTHIFVLASTPGPCSDADYQKLRSLDSTETLYHLSRFMMASSQIPDVGWAPQYAKRIIELLQSREKYKSVSDDLRQQYKKMASETGLSTTGREVLIRLHQHQMEKALKEWPRDTKQGIRQEAEEKTKKASETAPRCLLNTAEQFIPRLALDTSIERGQDLLPTLMMLLQKGERPKSSYDMRKLVKAPTDDHSFEDINGTPYQIHYTSQAAEILTVSARKTKVKVAEVPLPQVKKIQLEDAPQK